MDRLGVVAAFERCIARLVLDGEREVDVAVPRARAVGRSTGSGAGRPTSPNGIIPSLLSFFAGGQSGSWVAWTLDDAKRPGFEARTPVDADRYPKLTAARVPLAKSEVDAFYKRFSKEAFWPMLHTFWERARFRADAAAAKALLAVGESPRGRDGDPAEAWLFWSAEDFARARRRIEPAREDTRCHHRGTRRAVPGPDHPSGPCCGSAAGGGQCLYSGGPLWGGAAAGFDGDPFVNGGQCADGDGGDRFGHALRG